MPWQGFGPLILMLMRWTASFYSQQLMEFLCKNCSVMDECMQMHSWLPLPFCCELFIPCCSSAAKVWMKNINCCPLMELPPSWLWIPWEREKRAAALCSESALLLMVFSQEEERIASMLGCPIIAHARVFKEGAPFERERGHLFYLSKGQKCHVWGQQQRAPSWDACMRESWVKWERSCDRCPFVMWEREIF